MAKFAMNYNGLRKRETYDEIIDYLQGKQEMIRYPDRFAKRIREHPYLTQLDGEGLAEIEEQQQNEWKEKEKEQRVREAASKGTQTAPEIRTQMRSEQGSTSSTQFFDLGKQDSEMKDEMDWTVQEHRKRFQEAEEHHHKRMARSAELLRSYLDYTSEAVGVTHFAAAAAAERSRSPAPMKNVKPEVKMKVDQEQKVDRSRSPLKPETKMSIVKQETRQQVPPSLPPPPTRGRGAKRSATTSVGRERSDSMQITGENANKSTDMKFWADQSANELRAQITFRMGRRADWAVKTKAQLLSHIKQMIKDGKW